MAVTGTPIIYHKKFKFLVYIGGVVRAAFQKAGPFEIENAIVETFEGGAIHADESLGRVKKTPVKCERGATKDKDLWNWFSLAAQLSEDAGLDDADPLLKRTMDIVQLSRNNKILVRWRAHECLPAKFVAGDWDNTADENVMESIEIRYKRLERFDT
jgi:phage tail-like protein